jgi:hypothetical protein
MVLIFDKWLDIPRRVRTAGCWAVPTTGIDSRLIYAFRRTGLIVTEQNLEHLTSRDLREWQAALEEYDRLQRKSH